ncbi:MAG: hypothetical protein OQK82_08280 [Candidatus Pacearchaeota archaeon]|nr:hypothetical protein [Candidatus Pacearchaeota archaeon]
MKEDIELLEYLKIPKNFEYLIDFGDSPQETIERLEKFLKRGYIKNKEDTYELTEKGENRLIELKNKLGGKYTTINLAGHNNNVVGNSEHSSINQKITHKLPKEDIKWYQNFLSSLISALGVKITLSLLGGLSIGTFIFNYFNTFNPFLVGEITLNNLIFFIGCFFAWLTYYAFKNSKENRCGKCGKYFSYKELDDSEILANAPNGKKAKVRKTLRCNKCGDEKIKEMWVDLE